MHFIFHVLEHKFHVLKHKFHVLQHKFHVVEHKIRRQEKTFLRGDQKKSLPLYHRAVGTEMMHRLKK